MRLSRQLLAPVLACAALVLAGCAGHYAVGYTAYDPYYSDYHPWAGPEPGYYNEWLVYTHHPQVEYKRLRPEEQRQYWQWRHEHHPEPAGRPDRDRH
jgi:hypothetical protein